MPGRALATSLLLFSCTCALASACDAGPISTVDAAMVDAPPLPLSRLLGRCESDAQCPGNGSFCRTAAEDGYPGGQCTAPCTDRTECDTGMFYGFCATLTGDTQSTCITYCRNGSDCRPGYSCQVVTTLSTGASAGYCFPVCGTDAECGGGAQCDPYTGRCVPQGMVPTTGGDTGDPCTTDAACRGNNCVNDSGTNGYLDGYCISLCRIPSGYNSSDFYSGDTLPSGTCGGSNSVCIPYGSQYGENDLGICLEACSSAADCRPGFECTQTVSGRTFTNGWCDPIDCVASGAGSCPAGTTCHTGTDSQGNRIGRCG